jgi:transposase
MHKLGVKGVIRRKTPRTTKPKAEIMNPADLVNRQFQVEHPNQLCGHDITYIKTAAGWVYAAFVIDVFCRMVTGWKTSTHLYTELALDALNMAVCDRQHLKHYVLRCLIHFRAET